MNEQCLVHIYSSYKNQRTSPLLYRVQICIGQPNVEQPLPGPRPMTIHAYCWPWVGQPHHQWLSVRHGKGGMHVYLNLKVIMVLFYLIKWILKEAEKKIVFFTFLRCSFCMWTICFFSSSLKPLPFIWKIKMWQFNEKWKTVSILPNLLHNQVQLRANTWKKVQILFSLNLYSHNSFLNPHMVLLGP